MFTKNDMKFLSFISWLVAQELMLDIFPSSVKRTPPVIFSYEVYSWRMFQILTTEYVKNNEKNVLTENRVSILCEIRTCAWLSSIHFKIKSRPRCRTIRCKVACFEGIDNGWFVYLHDQWCITGNFYSVFKHFFSNDWFLVKVTSFSRFGRFARYTKTHQVLSFSRNSSNIAIILPFIHLC